MNKMQTVPVLELDPLVELFRLLADPTRLRILVLLYHRELCVCEISDILNISQPKISRHIAKLRTTGLVNLSRHAQWVFYQLNRDENEQESVNNLLVGILQQILDEVHKGNYQEIGADIARLHEKERTNGLCKRD